MLVSTPPQPNPRLIEWARKDAGYDVARVAKRLQLPEEKVQGWESTGKPPTVRQLMNLAAFLQRPLTLFFQEEPPRLTPLTAEYRRLPNVVPGEESPEFRLAIRHMAARRQDALDLIEELGDEPPEFTLRAHLSDDPKEVGARLRERIGITSTQQEGWRDGWQAWREWRATIEEIGVLVFMFPKVALEEARGVALLRSPWTVAAVNTKEVVESRAFTALHEVVHLMLAAANEESSALTDTRTAGETERLERFAEVAASHALVLEEALAGAVGDSPPTDVPGMRTLAARFRITPLAAATRLQQSGYLTWPQYKAWRTAWDAYLDALPKEKGGFATPVGKTLGRGGRTFSQLVLEAFDNRRITTADAARLLNLRPDHFDTLRQKLISGSNEASADE